MERKTINFDVKKVKKLVALYLDAVKTKKEVFIFDGSEILTKYAKYLLEYLSQFEAFKDALKPLNKKI